jgi:intracellular sulfur oxidation DsrE/DsrF family protein
MRLKPFALAILLAAGWGAAHAQAIPGYGKFTPLPQAHEQPNATTDYKVVMDVSQGAKTPDAVNPGLDRMARLANILSAGGAPRAHQHLALVVHGGATDSVVTDEAYARRHDGLKNPNTALLAALRAAGVSVRICGQSMLGSKLSEADLAPGVQLDVAALMTVTDLQLAGYALVVN